MVDDIAVNWMATPRQVEGVSLNMGIGLGQAVVHQSAGGKVTQNQEALKDHLHKDKLVRLDRAFIHLVDEIQALIFQKVAPSKKYQAQSQASTMVESQEILDVHLSLARDPGWKRQLRERIQAGMTAVTAIEQTLHSIREKLGKKEVHSHWRERISDFEDLSGRLKRHFINFDVSKGQGDGSPIIVVADRIGPAELLDYDRNRLAGLILVEQSQTSHVAIVARSLEIPVVGGMNTLLEEVNPGDALLVDGNEGRVYIHPAKEVVSRYRYNEQLRFKETRHFELSEPSTPLLAKTLDGVSISLLLNAGLVEDVDHIDAAGAEGIGLYRTEIPFMMRHRLPNVNEQVKLYQEILERAGGHSVVFRTLDVGGDKVLPYLERLRSEAPAKKRRTANFIFDRPILLRYQLRAFIRASANSELKIMLPMVAEVSEIQAARELLDGEIAREKEKGNPVPAKVKLGAMIEVPSLVYQLPQLFPHVDFLSLGSNDLFQFFYAIDREYPKLTDRYDVLSPTFLSMLKSIQDQCQAAHVPLSICGEMAGRPLEALALIGLGYRALSMSAAAVPMIKAMVRSLRYQEISSYMAGTCIPSYPSIRQNLQNFARDHGIHCE